MKPTFAFVANWKMYLSPNEESEFLSNYSTDLIALIPDQASLVICPSYLSLPEALKITTSPKVSIGAQACSAYGSGAHTGDISAAALAQIGISHCIVGHSERRTQHHETNQNIAEQAQLLLKAGICPIVCIGETEQERAQSQTNAILEKQLEPIKLACKGAHLWVAYEPIWAIGTGKTPTNTELEQTSSWLKKHLSDIFSDPQLLYGGSISPSEAGRLSSLSNIDGFLIGRASVDFQALKKIVRSCYTPQ
ncbi:triose-phosphate isomerase [Candidatus Babeliales bacterium]|nr:triose-phosphate isomerase [Candidatus Babeliales bacterium]